MVFRQLLARLFLNNEVLIQRLSEFYPIRRGAQLLVYIYTRGKSLGEQQLDKALKASTARRVGEEFEASEKKITSFRQRFSQEINEGYKEMMEELKKKHGKFKRVYSDLMSPAIILLFLIFQVSRGLLVSGKYPGNGSAVGYAMIICFSYIMFVPLAIFSVARVFGTLLSYVQVLSLCGYSLVGHCIVLFLSSLFQEENSSGFFLLCLTIFGGLSTGRLALILITKTSDPGSRLILGSLVSVTNLLFLIYLHFSCMQRTLKNNYE